MKVSSLVFIAPLAAALPAEESTEAPPPGYGGYYGGYYYGPPNPIAGIANAAGDFVGTVISTPANIIGGAVNGFLGGLTGSQGYGPAYGYGGRWKRDLSAAEGKK
jgi:hypothetical protein